MNKVERQMEVRMPGFSEVVVRRWAGGDVYVVEQIGDKVHLDSEGVRRLIEVLGELLGGGE